MYITDTVLGLVSVTYVRIRLDVHEHNVTNLGKYREKIQKSGKILLSREHYCSGRIHPIRIPFSIQLSNQGCNAGIQSVIGFPRFLTSDAQTTPNFQV